jgi:23S rRNA pseudouridine955/2504/2580 synthase
MVFSTSLEGARRFSALLRERRIKKRYLALVDGILEESEFWEDLLVRDREAKKTFIATVDEPGARRAGTRVFPLKTTENSHRNGNFLSEKPRKGKTLVLLEIETGRTHQIRSQAAFHGHPLAGDRKYGGSPQAEGLLLHALSLEFPPELCSTAGAVPGGNPGTKLNPAAGMEQGPLFPAVIKAPLTRAFSRKIQELFGSLPEDWL